MKSLGIDWGHREHVIALLDEDGRFTTTERLSARDMPALLERLEQLGGPGGIQVAVETGAPLLVSTLAARGYVVDEVAPDRADRLRALHFPGGAKDDPRDAKAVAFLARHRELGLRARRSADCRSQELWMICGTRQRLVRQRTRAVQQLVDLVRRAHPGLAALDLDFTCGYALELVGAYPDPLRARRARTPRIARILRRGQARRLDAATVARRLREHGVEVPEHVARACALEAPLLAARIALLGQQIRQVERAIAATYDDHPDKPILRSLPGCGAQLAPRINAYVSSSVVRDVGATQIRIFAGTAPRTVVSGRAGPGTVHRRVARNRDLHDALVQMARCSIRSCAWARAFVVHHTGGNIRNRKRMNKALRALANKWVRILHTLLLRGQTYDDARHVAHLRNAGVAWAPAEPPTD